MLIKFTLIICLFCILKGEAEAEDFFIDPINGSNENDGTYLRPWASLDYVFNSNKINSTDWSSYPAHSAQGKIEINPNAPIRAGDTLYLMPGYYGNLIISNYYNTDYITIKSFESHTAVFNAILVRSSEKWRFDDIAIRPNTDVDNSSIRFLFNAQSHNFRGDAAYIDILNSKISSVDVTQHWSALDWVENSKSGIAISAHSSTVMNNTLFNVYHAIKTSAQNTLIAHNYISDFAGDGIRISGAHNANVQSNVIKNCYLVNGNHPDGIQLWGENVEGELHDVLLENNLIINYQENKNHPLRCSLQGIGMFDGHAVNLNIRNNKIFVDNYHGISVYGGEYVNMIGNVVSLIDQTIKNSNGYPIKPRISLGYSKRGVTPTNYKVEDNISYLYLIKDQRVKPDGNFLILTP